MLKRKLSSKSSSRSSSGSSEFDISDHIRANTEQKRNLYNIKEIPETSLITLQDFLRNRNKTFSANVTKDCVIYSRENNEVYINNTRINVYKFLGNGANGIVFLGIDQYGNKCILKFMKSNKREVSFMKKISTFIDHYHHFVKLYSSYDCNKIDLVLNEQFSVIHKPPEFKLYEPYINMLAEKNNKYELLIIEQFDGDFEPFFKSINRQINSLDPSKRNYLAQYNKIIQQSNIKEIMAQMYICVFLLHKIGYYHNDTHLGNFFYKRIINNDNEYFHYNINGNNYYIKNVGFFIFLGDYGKTSKISKNKQKRQKTLIDFNTLNLNAISYGLLDEEVKSIMDDNELFQELVDKEIFLTSDKLPRNHVIISSC